MTADQWTAEADDVYDVLDSIWDTRDLLSLIQKLTEAMDDGDEEAGAKLADALELEAEIEPYAEDYRYGATVIRDDEFEDYARQLAEDIGAIDSEASWPLGCIDWAEAARLLQQDYTSFEYDGCTWWVR